MRSSKKILVKIGSNVLTLSSGLPDRSRMAQLVNQITTLKTRGYEVILVSSGAVAAGRSVVKSSKILDSISERQVLASVGQIELMKIYSDLFQQKKAECAQVLVTKEDFRTRQHYLNIKNCLEALLKSDVTPIINENDVVSITELMFTDNDELSGLVASMMDVQSLFLLSNVDGIFTAHPEESGAKLIRNYREKAMQLEEMVTDHKSEFGRGGMLSKATTAEKIAALGIDVYIGNGAQDHIIESLMAKETGTFFEAENQSTSTVKKWLSQSGDFSKACIVVNQGAKEALISAKASSLLPVGVLRIEGDFEKGDVIHITDEDGNKLGIGKVACDAATANACLGERGHAPLVHYNYLVLEKNQT
jgi:glutamate 5-kinase